MKQVRSKQFSPNAIDLLVHIVGVVGFFTLIFAITVTVPWAFQVSPSWYSVLAAISVVANAWLLLVLSRRPAEGVAMIWLGLFIFLNILWGSAEFMHRLMSTPEGNAFWSHLEFAIVAFMPTTLYLFIRSYITRNTESDTWRTPVVFLGGAASMALLISANDVLPVMPWSAMQAWGWPAPATPVTYVFSLWIILVAGAAIAQLFRAHQAETSARLRKPLLWIAMSAIFLVVSEVLTAIILPAMGWGVLPPLGVLASTIMAVGIIYGVFRYDAFSINIGQLADVVLVNLSEAVIVTDPQGKVVYANRAAQTMLGDGSQHVVGGHISRVAHGLFGRALKTWHKSDNHDAPIEVILDGPSSKLTLNVRIADAAEAGWGHTFVLSDITQLRLANQRLTESQAELGRALTHSQQLEHQLRQEKAGVEQKVEEATATLRSEHARLVTSINSLSLGLVLVDASSNLIMVNQQTQAVLASSLGLGRGVLEVDSASLKGPLDRLFGLSAKVATCLATRRSQRYPVFDVADRLVSVSVSPILDEAAPSMPALGAVALIEDVTDAQNLERARDEFFSIASHELRTPLTAIRGNSSMLQSMSAEDIAGYEGRAMLDDIHDSSVRLIKIVNDFLDVSLVEQNLLKYHLEPVDVRALSDALVTSAKTKAYQGVSVTIEDNTTPLYVLADPRRLEQVLTELLDNAVKHTVAGSVAVSFRENSGFISVVVKDTGKGIDPDHRHLLFRKFQLASDNIFTRDATRSTGLGLYLARRLILGMGGKLELVDSRSGVGSTFAVTLPTATPKSKTSPKSQKA